MKKIISITVLSVSFAAIVSCNKAGTGGDATIVVFPKHHGVSVPGTATHPDSVFIKFNAEDLPDNPTTNYDALFTGNDGHDHVHCEGLKAGKYYVYATGWDTTINQRVTGGAAVKIKHKERKEEVDVDIAVTE